MTPLTFGDHAYSALSYAEEVQATAAAMVAAAEVAADPAIDGCTVGSAVEEVMCGADSLHVWLSDTIHQVHWMAERCDEGDLRTTLKTWHAFGKALEALPSARAAMAKVHAPEVIAAVAEYEAEEEAELDEREGWVSEYGEGGMAGRLAAEAHRFVLEVE